MEDFQLVESKNIYNLPLPAMVIAAPTSSIIHYLQPL